MVRPEELLLDPALGGDPDLLRALIVGQQAGDRRPRLLEVARVRQQHARSAILDLIANAADPARHDRPLLPHGLGDRQAEPLREALLHDHAGVPLERVDDRRVLLDVVHRQRAQVHSPADRRRQVVPRRAHAVQDLGALGIVGNRRR